jgi:hypothetical protein
MDQSLTRTRPLILVTSLTSLSSADSIGGLVKSWRCNNDGRGFSEVDCRPKRVTFVRFVMDLSEVDGGSCSERSTRYGGDVREMSSQVTLLSTEGSLENGTTIM